MFVNTAFLFFLLLLTVQKKLSPIYRNTCFNYGIMIDIQVFYREVAVKKFFLCIISAVLSAFMIFSLASCSLFGSSAMKIGSVSMSEEVYAYYMSCYRPYWIYTFGEDDTEEFWASSSNGVTVAEYLQDVSLTAIKTKLVAEYLFEENRLTLSDAKEAEIQTMIDGLLLGIGGKEEFEKDELMKELGLTVDDMYDIFRIDAKAQAVQDYLYGESGKEVVNAADRNEYYRENYCRYKQVYIMDVDFVYDEDGKIKYDKDGYAITEELTDERWEEKFTHAQSLLERAENGEDFDELIIENTEELSYDKYPYGHYFNKLTTSSDNYFSDISDTVMDMETGEVRLIKSNYGLHLIQKLELDENGYDHTENTEDFKNFNELVEEEKFKKKLMGYFDDITVDEEIIGKYPIDKVIYSESWTYMF